LVQKNLQRFAIIGDLRNGENFLVSQTHVAFIKFHNAIVDYLLATDPQKYVGEGANPTLFRDASMTARWNYQWIIVHEFLLKILGAEVVQEVLTHSRLFYRPAEQGYKYPYMPVEFSTAAYRLGHAMLRQHYVINDGFQANLFDMPVFGNPRIDATKKLDFTKFFDFPGKPAAQRARRYGAIITPPIFELPFIDPTDDPPVVLPQRNMLRARLFKVPSGQEVATLMKERRSEHRRSQQPRTRDHGDPRDRWPPGASSPLVLHSEGERICPDRRAASGTGRRSDRGGGVYRHPAGDGRKLSTRPAGLEADLAVGKRRYLYVDGSLDLRQSLTPAADSVTKPNSGSGMSPKGLLSRRGGTPRPARRRG
jgi:Animal haem peroxidase